jgi:PAS domain S-box-containing protein
VFCFLRAAEGKAEAMPIRNGSNTMAESSRRGRERPTSIRRKLTSVILMISCTVVGLTAAAFISYEMFTFRYSTRENLSTLAEVLAANSSGSLAFTDVKDARQVLSALQAEPQIVMAALYDRDGILFASYPTNQPPKSFPETVPATGFRFARQYLEIYQPVRQGDFLLGTLYIKSDLSDLQRRVRLYLCIALGVLAGSGLLAWFLSAALQRRISNPILALTDTARAVSERRDYSVRAARLSDDEIGVLTDAFNQMLDQIEESSQARMFLAAIVESSDDAIVGKDLAGQVVSWNLGAEQMFGYKAREMIGKTVAVLAPTRYNDELAALEKVHRGETVHFETIQKRKSGEDIHVSITMSPIRDGNGRIIGSSAIKRDITERKKAEEENIRLKAELEQRVQSRTAELAATNKELEAFTYSVAHDLRAPLRHMDAYASAMEQDYGKQMPPQMSGYLQRIIGSSHKMANLVDDLLNLARVGRAELKRQPTSLDILVAEVVQELKDETKNRNIDWKIGSLGTVNCDPGLMKLVWVNLLGNALKYSRPRATAIIEVDKVQLNSTSTVANNNSPNNGESTFRVRDNGVGFDMRFAEKLFGVFQRLHRAEEFEGTGVGLATVERIVHKHGGRIWAEAEVDKGATFYFTLAKTQVK